MAESAASMLAGAKRTAVAILYWEKQLESAAVATVGTLWFLLIGWFGYSSITVLCNLALFHLTARVVYRTLLNLLVERPTPEPPEVFVTEADLVQHSKAIIALVNKTLHAAYNLLFCDLKNPLVFKWMVALWLLSLASKVFGTTGTCFIGFAAVMSLPKLYQVYRIQIDSAVERVATKIIGFLNHTSSQACKHYAELSRKLTSTKKNI